ncbi:TonB-dependent receptor [Telluribacter sp.]|jgi:iron complex outermembrane receptor protein|uniref:TonB-dependent receptor n=1 Tax=Telluribacter sp. TaxID=1978767 RepID=UPI002E0FCED3|nr:TonB-dependent receptor [Telluribacter sp.]
MKKFTYILPLFLLVAVAVLRLSPARAQSIPGSIKGKVTSTDGQPVSMVSVSLKNTKAGTITDENGEFILSNLEAGTYTLLFTAVGFGAIERQVLVNGGQASSLEVAMPSTIEQLSEIVVTASRKPESVQEVPSAMTIVGRRQIQEQIAMNADITNVLQYTVPGLAVATGRSSNTGQTLRGRQVLVLVDGVPQSTPLRNGGRDLRTIDPSAIERIEVIKGATSIYGNGADGGIINYITKRPDTNQPLAGQTWVGLTSGLTPNNAETMGYRLSQQFSGRSDKFDYVFNGTYERSGLMRDANGVAVSPFYNTGQMNNYNVLGKLGYTINSKQRVEAMYNYFAAKSDLQYVEQVGKYGQTPTIGIPTSDAVPGTPQGTPYNHNATLRYSFDRLVGGTGLEVVAYAQSFRTVYGYEAQFFEGGGQSNIVSDKKGIRLNLNTPLTLTRNLTGELLYGADLLNDQTAQKLQDGRFWTPNMNMTNLAPYAQLKLDLFRNLILKAGARFENINVNVSDFSTLKTYNAARNSYDGGIFVGGGELNYSAFVGNVGLRYSGLEAFQPFVSFSQAFSINELGRILRTAQTSIIADLKTEPVIVNNYEAGVSGTISRYFHYDVAYYQSFSQLGASFRQQSSGVFEIVRAPEKVWGYEVSADVSPTKYLTLGGSYSFVEGQTDANNDGTYETYLGGDRIMAPKTTVYVRIQPLPALVLNVNALISGNRDRFEPGTNGLYTYGRGPVESFTLVNFNGSYNINPKTTLSLGVENLLNTDYYPTISLWAARNADYIKAPGRRGMFTVSYKF